MTTIRPNAEPAATTVQVGDIFLIDGTTGVRALDASKVPLRDANTNVVINNVVEGFASTATAAGTTVLDVTSSAQQFFTGATTQTVTLPVTSTLALGQGYYFQNSSTGAVTIQSSGANAVLILAPGASALVTCILLTGTTAASWQATYVAGIVASGKKLTVSNSLTLAGTDGMTMTFPSTSATIARTDAGQTFTGTNAFGVLTATTVNGLAITASAGTLTIPNNASAALIMSGNFSLTFTVTGATNSTLPSGTHTLVGQDTTDTLTNKTFDTAGTGNSFKINGQSILTNTGTGSVNVLATNPAIVGTATNDNAASGIIGEYINSTIAVGSAVSLTTSTVANMTSISLTAGDWDVCFTPNYTGGATTTVSFFENSISLTTATQDRTENRVGSIFYNNAAIFGTLIEAPVPVGPVRLSLSGTTTVFAVVRANFATSTCSVYGTLRARRIR